MRNVAMVVPSRSSRLRRLGLALPFAAVVALAACGSSKSYGGSSSSNGASTPTSVPVAATANPVVMVARTSKFGPVLVDHTGMTLYTLTNAGRPVPCTGKCLTFWPPLLLPAGDMSARGSAGVHDLGVVSMTDGTQVAQHGDPLYRFAGDKAPGDTNGEGLRSFGGVWNVASTSGVPAAAPATTAPPAGMGGYGGYGGYGG